MSSAVNACYQKTLPGGLDSISDFDGTCRYDNGNNSEKTSTTIEPQACFRKISDSRMAPCPFMFLAPDEVVARDNNSLAGAAQLLRGSLLADVCGDTSHGKCGLPPRDPWRWSLEEQKQRDLYIPILRETFSQVDGSTPCRVLFRKANSTSDNLSSFGKCFYQVLTVIHRQFQFLCISSGNYCK